MQKLLLSFLCCLSGVKAHAQWQPVSDPVGVGTELFVCHLDPIDAQVAWFANTSYSLSPFATQISRTTNGGQTWQSVGPASTSTSSLSAGRLGVVEAVDAQHAWVITGPATPTTAEAELHYTADGGTTWSRRPLPAVTPRLDMLRFFSLTEGLVLDQVTGALFRTTDGGLSWLAQNTFPTLSTGLRLSGLHQASGLLWTTVYTEGLKPSAVWTSPDRGLSWQVLALPPSAPRYGEVVFRDAQHALVSAPSGDGSFLATADGGLTWQSVTNPPVKASILTAVPGTRAYIVGGRYYNPSAPTITGSAITYDEGQSWTSLETAKSYLSIQFTSPTAGWQILSTIAPVVEDLEYRGIARYAGPPLGGPLATRPTSTQTAIPEVFPNPSASGHFTVRLPATAGSVIAVRVFDALGRTVYQAATLPPGQRLDLSHQLKGSYLLVVQTTGHVSRCKLLIE